VNTWLLKPGELALKGGNRKTFERILIRNLRRMLSASCGGQSASCGGQSAACDGQNGAGSGRPTAAVTNGRFYVHCEETDNAAVEAVLGRLMGISGFALTQRVSKTAEAVLAACVREGRQLAARGISTFKIEARRTDKSFPLDSFALRNEGGSAVLAAVPSLSVDVHKPGAVIQIEIREQAYVYSSARRGLGGLPSGSAGRGLLLLSGGIDSPVAGFLMAGRGMSLDAVHFHAYPYTSTEAKEKAIRLARQVGAYSMGVRLSITGFTKVQMRIKERSPLPWATILLRMAMMDCAGRLARGTGCQCLITGESLSQVASQTIENLTCTQSTASLPVLRPLIGMDKEHIITASERIGTYRTSIEPYEDCCVLFSPPHPILHGDIHEAAALYQALELEPLLTEALNERETLMCLP
jgi:thiamine biosynthesis protein ThiI